jgi:NAD(P)-dependent dehydrogenase (short-subunit alcohol dehydrogenase family)
MARDLSQLGIRVATIAPGLVHTPLFDGLRSANPEMFESLSNSVLNPRRLGKPDEIASTAQWIVENDYVNGETIRVDGGIRMQPR